MSSTVEDPNEKGIFGILIVIVFFPAMITPANQDLLWLSMCLKRKKSAFNSTMIPADVPDQPFLGDHSSGVKVIRYLRI